MVKDKPSPPTPSLEVLDCRNPSPSIGRTVLQYAFGFVMVHYLFFGMVAGIALYFVAGLGPLGLFAAVGAALAYLPSFLTPYHKKNGRVWVAFRDMWLWRLVQEYLQLRIIRTVELDGTKQYIFGWHPHGIIILSRVSVYGGVLPKLFPGIDMRVLGATPMFLIPGCREICLWLGAIDASKHVAEKQLKDGLSLFVYPGGSKEIFHTDPLSTDTKLELSHRLGFVKLAMKYGTPLVPVFVFGEKWCYHKVVFPEALRKWCLKVLRIPLLLFWGRWFTLMPLKTSRGMGVVYGAPLEVPKVDNPTQEEIEAVMKRYQAAVVDIFNTHKATFGYGKEETLTIL